MSQKKKDTRSRGWCFTVPNFTDEDLIKASALFTLDDNCSYLIIGEEIAPRTGMKHLQCYVYYTNAVSFRSMRTLLPDVHIEAQKSGKNVKAYVYCMEDYNYVEFGSRPRQGHRTDLEVIKHDIVSGRPINNGTKDDIAHHYFSQWCQYRRAFDEFQRMNSREETDCQIGCYDSEQVISQIKIIYRDYRNFTIVDLSTQTWLDVAKAVASGKYAYVFIPNIPWFVDKYSDEIDFTIF